MKSHSSDRWRVIISFSRSDNQKVPQTLSSPFKVISVALWNEVTLQIPNLCGSEFRATLEGSQAGVLGNSSPRQNLLFFLFFSLWLIFFLPPCSFSFWISWQISPCLWLNMAFYIMLLSSPSHYLSSLLRLNCKTSCLPVEGGIIFLTNGCLEIFFSFFPLFFGVKIFVCREITEKYCKIKWSCENKVILNAKLKEVQ